MSASTRWRLQWRAPRFEELRHALTPAGFGWINDNEWMSDSAQPPLGFVTKLSGRWWPRPSITSTIVTAKRSKLCVPD